MRVVTVERAEYPSLLELWEDTVRATHDFLSEEDIQFFKSLILHQYLDVVELRCVRNVFGKIIGDAKVFRQASSGSLIRVDIA